VLSCVLMCCVYGVTIYAIMKAFHSGHAMAEALVTHISTQRSGYDFMIVYLRSEPDKSH